METVSKVYVLCRLFNKKGVTKKVVFNTYPRLEDAVAVAKKLTSNERFMQNQYPGVFYILEYPLTDVSNVIIPIKQ